MFRRNKIKIKIVFDIETGSIKLEFNPKETRPSKVLLILGDAQILLDEELKKETGTKKKYLGYIH